MTKFNKTTTKGIAVKIQIYQGAYSSEVVYYRYNMPPILVFKWKWYFEYLAARIKVSNPRNKVELIITQQNVLCGDDYVQEKIKNLLKRCRSELNRLERMTVNDDLFGNIGKSHAEKIAKLRNKKDELENGSFKLSYIPPTYINSVKKWI